MKRASRQNRSPILGTWFAACLCASAASAADLKPPVVVEMFVSQSCAMSPPAAAALHALSERTDVIALGWHVDYWDVAFPSIRAGAWVDPYAIPDASARQRRYNERIRRSARVMTPQAVVDGTVAVAGNKAAEVDALLADGGFDDQLERQAPLSLALEAIPDGIQISVSDTGGEGRPYDVIAVSFVQRPATTITGGVNSGKIFVNVNVVAGLQVLSRDISGSSRHIYAGPPDGYRCAILIQEPGQGSILAGRYCS